MATPLSIQHLGPVASTQHEARHRYAGDPLLVTALGQSAGRGRSGSEWLNADRPLAASLVFEPDWPPDATPLIPLMAALAVIDLVGSRLRLKWPNDLLLSGRKVGGILTESIDEVVIVGLGLNVYWPDPPEGMGALHSSDPGENHVRAVAERWASALLTRVDAGPLEWGRTEYLASCDTVGMRIEWEPDGVGDAVGVDDGGGLIVETSGGSVTIRAGEVRHLRRE